MNGKDPSPAPWHLVVWIDHAVAHLYASNREKVEEIATIHAPDQGRGHVHHHAGTPGPGHVPPDSHFLSQVANNASVAREILIIGPSTTPHDLHSFMKEHAPGVAERVVGIEPMKRASEREIHEFSRRFFRHHDLMAKPGSER